ncbi:Conserved_hypothetical protein [Hexamita inflata]|uniref:HNH homing endonuclease n=1 Tax=Hexamita inflata TaxID=28002 RepID=A0AA86TEG3_9EUKA|nr:Conserved hypothetical protein [Hexamita inflata]CAI9977101.1 Conserved hypothetical protein [Hexamita inflata]
MSDIEDYSQSEEEQYEEEYEDFYPIKDFDNYEITKNGIVRNIKTQKVLKQYRDKDDYFIVSLFNEQINKYQNHGVHRLVALSFIENPDNLPIVDHISRDNQDNRVENLRWVTNRVNLKNRKTSNNITYEYFDELPDEENCIEFQCYNGYQFGHYYINTETLEMYYDTDYQFRKLYLNKNNTYCLYDTINKRRYIYLPKLQRDEYN